MFTSYVLVLLGTGLLLISFFFQVMIMFPMWIDMTVWGTVPITRSVLRIIPTSYGTFSFLTFILERLCSVVVNIWEILWFSIFILFFKYSWDLYYFFFFIMFKYTNFLKEFFLSFRNVFQNLLTLLPLQIQMIYKI